METTSSYFKKIVTQHKFAELRKIIKITYWYELSLYVYIFITAKIDFYLLS